MMAADFMGQFLFAVVRRGRLPHWELFLMRVCLFVLAVLCVAHSSAHAEKRYAVLVGANTVSSDDFLHLLRR